MAVSSEKEEAPVRLETLDGYGQFENLVKGNWLYSYRRSPWSGCVPHEVFDTVYGAAIDRLVNRGAKISVLVNPDDPDHALGWCCWEVSGTTFALHYAYVKLVLQGRGLLGLMLRSLIPREAKSLIFTFKTFDSEKLRKFRYKPVEARRKEMK